MWRFSAKCPQGHHVTQDGFPEDTLRQLLFTGEVVRLYCVHCDHFWDANDTQRRTLSWALDQRR